MELPSGTNTLIATVPYSPLPSILDAAVTPDLTYSYTIRATNSNNVAGPASAALEVTILLPTDTAEELPPGARPAPLRLEPNPFNPSATVSFRVERTGPVELDLYDARGRRVSTLARGILPAGEHRVPVFGDRGARVASGVYFLRLHADGRETRLKAVLLR